MMVLNMIANGLLVGAVCAQTYSHCNPLHEKCQPNPALGRALAIDFAADGPSSAMVRSGSATLVYDGSEGAQFSIADRGHNPTLNSKFYIMFGRVEVVARASQGGGIVSSIVLQSDDLDEIDIEFVGSDSANMQSNYFSKGDTSTYDRGLYHAVPGGTATTSFHKYTVDWTADSIKWYIDNRLVRTLRSSDRPEIFPQTPMSVRIGSWAAGDPTMNEHGTVEWAGGPVDYGAGPFVFAVKSLAIVDYSSGTNYEYTDQSGTWTSIRAHNGQVGASGPMSNHLMSTLLKLSAKH